MDKDTTTTAQLWVVLQQKYQEQKTIVRIRVQGKTKLLQHNFDDNEEATL